MLKLLLFNCVVIVLFGGVTANYTTGDPRRGGLCGWSEDKAIQRQNELHRKLKEEQNIESYSRQSMEQLKRERARLRQKQQEQDNRINSLDARLVQMQRQLNQQEAATDAKVAEKQKLESELARIKREIHILRMNRGLSIEDRKRMIDQLNREIEQMLALIANM